MHVSHFSLGPLGTNAYLLENKGKALCIDPGGDPQPILQALGNTELTHILITHLHCDHLYGVQALSEATGAVVLASTEDNFLLDTELGTGGLFDLPTTQKIDFAPLHSGENNFISLQCKVLATPGHSPGSLSFYFPELKAVFTGDLIFYRSVGRTDFLGGDAAQLKKSVIQHIFTLPPETIIYPGHDRATNVGDEMCHNPFFSDF